jgi:hypothetical protein
MKQRPTVDCVISVMKQQLVVTHTIRQTEIPPLPDTWVTNTLSVKMMCPQKEKLLLFILVPIPCIIEYIKTDQQMH